MSTETNLSTEGTDEFKAAIWRFSEIMQENVNNRLSGWASDVVALVKQRVPARSGRLRSSITARITGGSAEVGSDSPYASAVEFGTSHMHARPFLFPTVQEQLPKLEQEFCKAIDDAKAEAGLT